MYEESNIATVIQSQEGYGGTVVLGRKRKRKREKRPRRTERVV